MSKTNEHFKALSPEEIQELKGQIGALLNYTGGGGWPTVVRAEIRNKLKKDDIEFIKSRLDELVRR